MALGLSLDLQSIIMAATHFCISCLMQISLVAKPNSEPYREGNSGRLIYGLAKLTQDKVTQFQN